MTYSSILDIIENLKQLYIEIQVSYAEDAFGMGLSMLCLSPVVAGKDIMIQEGSTSICAYQYGHNFDEALRDIWFAITHADYIIIEKQDYSILRYRWNGKFFEEFVKE